MLNPEKMGHRSRYVPLVRNRKVRIAIGLILVAVSATAAGGLFGKGRVGVILLITTLAWIAAVWITDKYVHKYPQRYFPYLIASHLKAAVIMAFFLWVMSRIAGSLAAPPPVVWTVYLFFVLADGVVSIFRRRDLQNKQSSVVSLSLHTEEATGKGSDNPGGANGGLSSIDASAMMRQIPSHLDKVLVEFIKKNLPDLRGDNGKFLLADDLPAKGDPLKSAPAGLLLGRTRLNDVSRLNHYLKFCVEQMAMGGYFVVPYMPLENVVKSLKLRYKGPVYWAIFLLHFIWYRAIPKIPWLDSLYFSPKLSWLDGLCLSLTKTRNRVLSKAEVWGRLSYWGMRVIAESEGDGEVYLIAQRVAAPVQGKRPSYYPIVALEKVGLNGQIIHAHKIRTMFPFSEFLQKRIFEDHGLAPSGKFMNDFRLTGFGKFLRKYWLDELPQIFDWLRGDVKLVGMRATSRQFLSLYPREFLDLYVQVKPGLIPPIFNESIKSFDQIVEVEFTYLQRYRKQPFRTDVRYLIQTFVDIVFKGIRSR